jgi:predicted nucleotidyltransferase
VDKNLNKNISVKVTKLKSSEVKNIYLPIITPPDKEGIPMLNAHFLNEMEVYLSSEISFFLGIGNLSPCDVTIKTDEEIDITFAIIRNKELIEIDHVESVKEYKKNFKTDNEFEIIIVTINNFKETKLKVNIKKPEE